MWRWMSILSLGEFIVFALAAGMGLPLVQILRRYYIAWRYCRRPFTGPFPVIYGGAIEWLTLNLPRFKVLKDVLAPKLAAAVKNNFSSWFSQVTANEVPALILSTYHWL